MRVLLDTHVLYWWWEEPQRIPPATLSLLQSPDCGVIVSAVSAFELANKARINKPQTAALKMPDLARELLTEGFDLLPVSVDHALLAGSMEGEHRDPVDRLLAAQSVLEQLPLVTRDQALTAFGCEVIW